MSESMADILACEIILGGSRLDLLDAWTFFVNGGNPEEEVRKMRREVEEIIRSEKYGPKGMAWTDEFLEAELAAWFDNFFKSDLYQDYKRQERVITLKERNRERFSRMSEHCSWRVWVDEAPKLKLMKCSYYRRERGELMRCNAGSCPKLKDGYCND